MGCGRCDSLPKIEFSKVNAYVSLPTQHHVEVVEKVLIDNRYEFEAMDKGFMIQGADFPSLVSFMTDSLFNDVEEHDVRILPLEADEVLSFTSLKDFRSLYDWKILYQWNEVSSIIREERIKTLFQPIVDIKRDTIYGYEALSRGIMKNGELMNPAELFSKAKEMDLLFYLDRVCRESSIRAASTAGIKEKIFINFIPTAIYQPELCLQSTEKVLKEEGLDSKQIVFEVVESERIVDFSHLNRILNYYRNKGFSTALDDLGSGYSNIDALMELKPDYMKIDLEIIRDIHKDPGKQEVLDAYIKNGKSLGLIILAEGVESAEEYHYLKEKEVDLIQGYYFGKPQEVPLKIES